MWRNTVVRDFIRWLREYNRHAAQPAGFYGLDLYSLHVSRRAVIDYLDKVDPAAARDARERYSCFDHFHDPQDYGYNTSFGIHETCKADVIKQLLALQPKAAEYRSRDGVAAEDEFFFAQQNAVLVRNAEEYYIEQCLLVVSLPGICAIDTCSRRSRPYEAIWAGRAERRGSWCGRTIPT